MKLEPLFARVLLERDLLKTRGGLIIPEDAAKRNQPARGLVIAVGPTCDESVKPGQRVLFGRYAGTEIKDGDKEYWVVNDEDVICVERS